MITKGFSGGGSGRGADVRRSPSRSSSRGDPHLSPPSSSSLSTSSSCFFPSLAPWGCGEFGFEAVELEAARALAEFSRPAPVRVWRESSQGLDMGTYWADDNSQIKNAICKKVEERVTTEENPEIPKSGGDCCMNFAAAALRHRRRDNLTEVEREARRIRRILANRESAQQTIRRRQALRDELSKRVADLSLDNQKMKVERELVMKEYHTLRNKNKQLKDEVAKAVECNTQGPEYPYTPLMISSLSSDHSMLVKAAPTILPCILHPWCLVNEACCGDANFHKIHDLSAPLYALPCALFCTLVRRISSSYLLISDKTRGKDTDSLGRWCSIDAEDEGIPFMCRESLRENHSSVAAIIPSKEKDTNVKCRKLDIDLNVKVTSMESLDLFSTTKTETGREAAIQDGVGISGDIPLDGDVVSGAKCLDATTAAAAARRRRRAIIKLKTSLKKNC